MPYRKLSIIFGIFFALISVFNVRAQTPEELQARIDQRNAEIQSLEKEIAEFQKQINSLSSQATSLAATVKSLDLTQKKLAADIKITENRIAAKTLEIQELSYQIGDKQETIEDDRRIIALAMSNINELGSKSIPEILLGSPSLSSAWGTLDELSLLQENLVKRVDSLRQVKAGLEVNKKETEEAKAELMELNRNLQNQRKVTLQTQNEKNQLLKETKQSEAQFQMILAQKKILKEAFEREILEYESQLRLAVDPNLIPKTGKGVLAWPVDNVYITQHFGETSFSTANPQIYNGKGHTGMDLRASIGTPIKAAASGIVVGTGNTDLYPGCYSYGKWIMIKHANGLSTLYAHLSLPAAVKGQAVERGQIIGYSGNTGYSTGPHLHFGVYATQGVQIKPFENSKNCKGATIPLADFKAYLNPLSYL